MFLYRYVQETFLPVSVMNLFKKNIKLVSGEGDHEVTQTYKICNTFL